MPASIPEFPDLIDTSIKSMFLKGSKRNRILTDNGFMPIKFKKKKVETLLSSTFLNEPEQKSKSIVQKRYFSV